MAKFEINNPEALKLIEDFKSGALLKPYIEKVKKIKWILISICLFFLFLIFFKIGQTLYERANSPVFLPPSLETPTTSTAPRQQSEFDVLRTEIFDFSTDLPDPVIPDLNNNIILKAEEI